MTQEMIEKAKQAKTTEELFALAKENGIEITEEEAKAYFEQLHPATGEMSDDELDNVSGGGCTTNGGYTTVTSCLECFTGKYFGNKDFMYNKSNMGLRKTWWNATYPRNDRCGTCIYLEFNGGIGYCSKSK